MLQIVYRTGSKTPSIYLCIESHHKNLDTPNNLWQTGANPTNQFNTHNIWLISVYGRLTDIVRHKEYRCEKAFDYDTINGEKSYFWFDMNRLNWEQNEMGRNSKKWRPHKIHANSNQNHSNSTLDSTYE